jgi:hypothetical protein
MENSFNNTERTLGDLNNQVDSTGRWYNALIGDNLGRTTVKLGMSLKDFIDSSSVANRKNVENDESMKGEFHAQRALTPSHANGLAKYTLMGLVKAQITKMNGKIDQRILKLRDDLGNPAYASLQPVVCNIRSCKPNGTDLKIRGVSDNSGIATQAYEIFLGARQHMRVVDGQHRREGFKGVLEFLIKVNQTYKYPNKGIFVPTGYHNEPIDPITHKFWEDILDIALSHSTIAIECHLGLVEEEEQQLFYDLNSKVKKVGVSTAFEYDHTDPVNKFIADELIPENILGFVPSDKDVSDWQKDDGRISRKDINTVTCLLALGKNVSKTATPALVQKRSKYVKRFWKIIASSSSFGSKNAKSKTILAQPVVLKALAKLAFDLTHGHRNIQDQDGYKKLCEAIISKELDFSHKNPLWTALLMSNEEREKSFKGISKFVHVPAETNLDAGTIDPDKGWVRFGSRHNDIFPRLGDTIRYALDLNPRPSVAKALAS